jgi:hypothetical protein
MKLKSYLLSIILIACHFLIGQKHSLSLIYGGVFTGKGDLNGKILGIGYQYHFSNAISAFGVFSQSNTSGSILNSFDSGQQRDILGDDNSRYGLYDLKDMNNNNSKQPITQGYLSHYWVNQNTSLDLGLKAKYIKSSKIDLFAEARTTFSKIELTTVTRSQYINIEEDNLWINQFGKREIFMPLVTQENFIDIGFGFGFGIEYKISSEIQLSFNPSYINYLKDGDNRVAYVFQLGYNL